MDLLLQVVQLIALLCVSALCIYLILVLLRVRSLLTRAEKDLQELVTRAMPIMDNAEYISARFRSVAENVDDQIMTVRDSIASIKQIAENVVEMEKRVQERIEGPVLDGVSFVAAVLKGARTFVDRMRS